MAYLTFVCLVQPGQCTFNAKQGQCEHDYRITASIQTRKIGAGSELAVELAVTGGGGEVRGAL
jgi:hypothetical protein